jgi:hypothetical protein
MSVKRAKRFIVSVMDTMRELLEKYPLGYEGYRLGKGVKDTGHIGNRAGNGEKKAELNGTEKAMTALSSSGIAVVAVTVDNIRENAKAGFDGEGSHNPPKAIQAEGQWQTVN